MARVGAALSMIACAMALFVAARGWSDNVEEIIGPESAGLKKAAAAYAETPKAQADEAEAASNIAVLLRETQFSITPTDETTTAQQITKTLKEGEPGMPVGDPLNQGGLQV